MHFRLGLNVRHADEQLRGTLMLPHGTGKDVRIAVFAEGDKAREAEEAGADIVGSADLAKRIEEGFTDFDVAIATPDQMGNVGRLGRVLGPRGLMPNPKTGTVTFEVGKAVREAKAGKLEYRTDRGANVHVSIGKKSFDERALVENYAAVVDEIIRAKPSAAKGRYIRQVTMASTMGPGIHVDPAKIRGILEELEEAGDRPAVQPDSPIATDRWQPRRQKPSAGGVRSRGFSHRLSEPAIVRARSVRGGDQVKKEDKEQVVADLTERLRTSDTLLVADYRGLTMPQIDTLRSRLIEAAPASRS